MPAQRLGSNSVSVFKYDVVAQDSPHEAGFVCHVGLADEERHDVSLDSSLALAHMGPPLEQRGPLRPIQVCGTADLKIGEIRQIGVFIDEQSSEYEADRVRVDQQYIIMPHCREPDASCSVRRFNCAGFVIEAYRYAGIDLLATDVASLPRVSLDSLCRAYPVFSRHLRVPKFRKPFGLEGNGPWPVVLAGYVLNSLNRPVQDIRNEPYKPNSGDEFFLPKPGEGDPS
jgi:hypothetical protein